MKKNSGFSLLEILIAMAILIIGVSAVINLFPVGLNASKRAADFTMVGILAQEKMAEVMYFGYDNVGQIHGDISGIPGSLATGTKEPFTSPDEKYRWHLDLATTWIPGLDTTLAKVTLWIYWNDRGTERIATFITYIADYTA